MLPLSEFAELEDSARTVSATPNYQWDMQHVRKRNTFADESCDDSEVAVTDSSQKFKFETYYVIIHRLSWCLANRIEAYTYVCDLFGVRSLEWWSQCAQRAAKLSSTYPTDLDCSLSDEFIQFKHFVQNETSPRLFWTLPVSNCEGERSFSVLKRVKKLAEDHNVTGTDGSLHFLSWPVVSAEWSISNVNMHFPVINNLLFSYVTEKKWQIYKCCKVISK